MNKLLIVLLAVCLISVTSAHTLIKRDAPAAPDANTNYLDQVTDQLKSFGDVVNKKISEALNPDKIKSSFNEFVDTVNKKVEELKPSASNDQKPAA